MNLAALHELAAQQASARKAAQALADRVRGEFGDRIEWIRLYGSLVRGDWMGPDESDVDVAFVVHQRTRDDEARIIRLSSEQLWQSGFVFSPRVFSPEEFQTLLDRELRLARDILAEGQLL